YNIFPKKMSEEFKNLGRDSIGGIMKEEGLNHWLRRNYLLTDVLEGTVNGKKICDKTLVLSANQLSMWFEI
ncbi:hypothetical protein L9F63_007641, partial [Diploptera punctata]